MTADAPMLIYVTTRDRDEALRLGRATVEARLAACANIADGVSSIYRWQGAVVEDSEALLILKTRASLVPALTDLVKSLHSYEVPCIAALPILDGNPAYLDWIAAETVKP